MTTANTSEQSSKRALESSNESVSIEPTTKKSKNAPGPSASQSNVAKSKKKTLDANAPKRGGSAFILFSKAERENIKKENPDVSNADIFKLLGEKWRDASADTKAKYDAEYKVNKAKADAEMRVYVSTLPSSGGSVESSSTTKSVSKATKPKAVRASADPSAPKRGGSAFILFSKAERENIKKENPDVSNANIFKLLGEKWREASADTKAKYDAEYKANKANVNGDSNAPAQTTVVAVEETTSVVTSSSHGDTKIDLASSQSSNLSTAALKSTQGKVRKSKPKPLSASILI